MTQIRFAVFALSLALTGFSATCQNAPLTHGQSLPTASELKHMASVAHSAEDYKALALSYSNWETDYLNRAAAEKQEMERRSQSIVLTAAKYPRPVDSSRNRYEYFSYKAREMATQSEKFSALAVSGVASPRN